MTIVDNRYWDRLLDAINAGEVRLGDDFRYYNHRARPVSDVDDRVYEAERRGWVRLLADGRPELTGAGRQWLDGRQRKQAAAEVAFSHAGSPQ